MDDYFSGYAMKYYKKYTLPLREKRKQMILKYEQEVKYSKEYLVPILDEIKCRVNKSKNNMWGLRYNSFEDMFKDFDISILADKSMTKDELLDVLQEFYTEEKQKEYGVLGIRIEI